MAIREVKVKSAGSTYRVVAHYDGKDHWVEIFCGDSPRDLIEHIEGEGQPVDNSKIDAAIKKHSGSDDHQLV